MAEKRKDSKGRNLRTGESQRKDGRYYIVICPNMEMSSLTVRVRG